ncbi:class I SAM-dependent methyltransferase [Streptomyces sp. MP131-18]|uniref:class I SAM-dependent methyltransferase n=1 Tax=Streptomyces sp. MP131-18 TaxID=1857892 RepID=UPI00097C7E04|nr:class I SAM-dependent methyltransferase [Streptomyces sp. MP131-18]ONK14645.1 Sarcosine/dimethylglycine N-methyltransferase [Streptomyces sp. MP131-18]
MTKAFGTMKNHGATDLQLAYHRRLFGGLFDWQAAERRITRFTGGTGAAGLMSLDQMGHFGPNGCDLVVERLAAPARLAEMGSGFGGALRYILDRLTERGTPVEQAYGVELVPEHCELSRTINESQGREDITIFCSSAESVPLPDASLDAVVITGSLPHFPRPDRVFQEAARLLRPGGALLCTEEVSLAPDGAGPAETFRELHPAGVFHTTPVTTRREQLRAAGLTRIELTDLAPWATDLLAARLKALRLFRGSAEAMLGTEEVDLVVRTLATAREEYAMGRLCPALVTAVRP